jgi:hypothetical protein
VSGKPGDVHLAVVPFLPLWMRKRPSQRRRPASGPLRADALRHGSCPSCRVAPTVDGAVSRNARAARSENLGCRECHEAVTETWSA